ncbi:MAG: putative nucleotidyltransferase component of viral defense system [Paraglaciecola sp.]
MSTPFDSSLFADVADAIGLSNPAIVEKDYYVVQLLQLINGIAPPLHDIVFSGGTALAKSSIKTYRMSEDVDLKIVPSEAFHALPSRSAKKKVRKNIRGIIEELFNASPIFSIDGELKILDEYRYMCFNIRYPQAYSQAPCLRPFIKLEFIESPVLVMAENREITSIYANVLKQPSEISAIYCATILETQAEKIVSMLRRTASCNRNNERKDDETLIRHIYDTYHIQKSNPSDIDELKALVGKITAIDVERYGNQHTEFVVSPTDELNYGLHLLASDPIHEQRYTQYLSPMVYAENPVAWKEAFNVFKILVNGILDF